jgi:hypothetical protein
VVEEVGAGAPDAADVGAAAPDEDATRGRNAIIPVPVPAPPPDGPRRERDEHHFHDHGDDEGVQDERLIQATHSSGG